MVEYVENAGIMRAVNETQRRNESMADQERLKAIEVALTNEMRERDFYLKVFASRLEEICRHSALYSYDSAKRTITYGGGKFSRRWQALQVSFFLWQSKALGGNY